MQATCKASFSLPMFLCSLSFLLSYTVTFMPALVSFASASSSNFQLLPFSPLSSFPSFLHLLSLTSLTFIFLFLPIYPFYLSSPFLYSLLKSLLPCFPSSSLLLQLPPSICFSLPPTISIVAPHLPPFPLLLWFPFTSFAPASPSSQLPVLLSSSSRLPLHLLSLIISRSSVSQEGSAWEGRFQGQARRIMNLAAQVCRGTSIPCPAETALLTT